MTDTSKIAAMVLGAFIASVIGTFATITMNNNDSAIKSNEREIENSKDIEELKSVSKEQGIRIVDLEKQQLILDGKLSALVVQVAESRKENRENFRILVDNQIKMMGVTDRANTYFDETGGGKLLPKKIK